MGTLRAGGKYVGEYANQKLYQSFKKKECELCGATNRLVVHHKDHNHSNSVESNLQTLCSKCHSAEHDLYKYGPRK